MVALGILGQWAQELDDAKKPLNQRLLSRPRSIWWQSYEGLMPGEGIHQADLAYIVWLEHISVNCNAEACPTRRPCTVLGSEYEP